MAHLKPGSPIAPVSSGATQGPRRHPAAFTLIELLVVVAIIALLVAIMVPATGHVRDLAKKAVCSARIKALGTASSGYVGTYQSYPHFAPWPWGVHAFYVQDYPNSGAHSREAVCAWPKTYGVLEMAGLKGTHRTNWGSPAYFWEADEIWPGALCPAMDVAGIMDWVSKPVPDLYVPMWKVELHPAAMGYQWNFRLRAETPYGRWTPQPDAKGDEFPSYALCQNVEWPVFLPNDPTAYAAQAVHPREVPNPAICAEAWDSPDFETLDWTQPRRWPVECLMPGMFFGPQTRGTNGWALLNGARHPRSPNVLYVDGSVRADVTRPVVASQLGACPSGNWNGLNVNSWPDWNDTFGTVHHVIPDPKL